MTEWWLRKAVICHLSPIFCNYYFIRDGIPTSPLTRSVGSVTQRNFWVLWELPISTHTLRGERDEIGVDVPKFLTNFNSHAPWGA